MLTPSLRPPSLHASPDLEWFGWSEHMSHHIQHLDAAPFLSVIPWQDTRLPLTHIRALPHLPALRSMQRASLIDWQATNALSTCITKSPQILLCLANFARDQHPQLQLVPILPTQPTARQLPVKIPTAKPHPQQMTCPTSLSPVITAPTLQFPTPLTTHV